MKRVFQTLWVVLTINSSIMAQKGFEVQKEITVNVSAEKLWQMVGPGFVDIYKWASNVDHATGRGQGEFEGAVCTERVCDVNVQGFSKISEKLTNYDHSKMNLAYEVKEGMPNFVTKAINDWTVVAIDEHHSKLVMNAKFESKGVMGTLMNGMMEKKMNKTLEVILNDAKVYAETEQQSETKQKRIAQLVKKGKMAT